jgi:hypothetical protein
MPRWRPHEIVSAPQSRQTACQFSSHICGSGGRPRCDHRQARRDGQKVLDTVAHFSCEQFMALFGLLASRNVEENAKHVALMEAGVVAQSTGRNPADQLADQDPKIDLVRPLDRPRCVEGCTHPVPIRRMNVRREVLEGDLVALRYVPERKRLLVHGEAVVVNVPRPQATPAACSARRK